MKIVPAQRLEHGCVSVGIVVGVSNNGEERRGFRDTETLHQRVGQPAAEGETESLTTTLPSSEKMTQPARCQQMGGMRVAGNR